MNPKTPVVVVEVMKLSLTDPQGLFDILIGGIVLLSALFLAYMLLFGTF